MRLVEIIVECNRRLGGRHVQELVNRVVPGSRVDDAGHYVVIVNAPGRRPSYLESAGPSAFPW